MSKITINVGTANNDGTGDPLRLAMEYVNFNFSEIYNTLGLDGTNRNITIANNIYIGNGSVNTWINSTSFSGTSYNADRLGNTAAAYYLANGQSRTLSGNLNFSANGITFNKGFTVNTNIIANSSGFFSNNLINAVSGNFTTVSVQNNVIISGDTSIAGNLTVSGTMTFINTTSLDIKDLNITVAKGSSNSLNSNGAGITIDGANVSIYYENSQNALVSNTSFVPYINNSSLGSDTRLWALKSSTINTTSIAVGTSGLTANDLGAYPLELTVTANSSTNNLFVNNYAIFGQLTDGYLFTGADTIVPVAIKESQNNRIHAAVQNSNTGPKARGEFIVVAPDGNTLINHVAFGICSNTYDNIDYDILGYRDGYMYNANGNMIIGTGGTNSVIFHTGGFVPTNERMRISPTGNVGIGNTSPQAKFVIATSTTSLTPNLGIQDSNILVQISAVDGANSSVVMDSNTGNYIIGRSYNNNSVNPVATPLGRNLLSLQSRGFSEAWITNPTAEIALVSEGIYSNTSTPTYIKFSTAATGSNSASERVRITASGNVGINNTAPTHTLAVGGIAYVSGNTTIGGWANVTTSVNSAILSVGTDFIANTTGAYHTGTVNAASHTTGNTTTGTGGISANITVLLIGNNTVNTVLTSAGLTVNGASVVNSSVVNAASHTIGTSLIANTIGVYHTGTINAASYTAGNTTTGTGGISSNVTTILVGNNTVNTVLTSAGLSVNGASVVNSSVVNAASHTIGTTLIANTTGIYHTGIINAASHTTTGVTANASGVYPASNSSGTTLGTATTRWVMAANTIDASGLITGGAGATITGTTNTSVAFQIATTFIANTIGVYHTGTVNAATISSGATFTANGTLVNTAAINITGAANTASLYATTSANVASVTLANGTGLYVSTNTFNLGTSTKAANGYTYLPNGVKMVWGWVSANSSTGDATFSSAFTTIYNVVATSNSAVSTYQAAVIGSNTSVAQIRTANVASTNVFWTAIGV